MKLSKKVKRRLLIVGLILVAVVIMMLPTQNYLESPGGAYEVSQILQVDNKPKAKGGFYFTAVQLRRALIFDYVVTPFKYGQEILPKKEVDGDGSHEISEVISEIDMNNSINEATQVAAKKANIPVSVKFDGIYVMDVVKSSNFLNKLHSGDVITKVDNQTFTSPNEIVNYIAKKKVGEQVNLEVQNEQQTRVISAPTIKLPNSDKTGIGITLIAKNTVESTPKVKSLIKNVGGPSAGLMFTLELYQEFTNQRLNNNQKIAGTGTISADGHVGSIGGIDKKVISAAEAGAKVFFAPSEQLKGMTKETTDYAIAKKTAAHLKTNMKIVPVESFDDALQYLTQQK